MRSNVFALLVGVGCGWLGAMAWGWWQQPDIPRVLIDTPPAPAAFTSSAEAPAPSPPDELLAQVAELEAANAALSEELAMTRAVVAQWEQTAQERQEARRDQRMDRINSFLQARLDERVAELRTALNLTPAQEAQLRNFITQATQERLSGGEAAFPFRGSPGSLENLAADEWQALLSPEQRTAYEELVATEFQQRNEVRALAELNRLPVSLRLSEPQKDALYSEIYSLNTGSSEVPIAADYQDLDLSEADKRFLSASQQVLDAQQQALLEEYLLSQPALRQPPNIAIPIRP